MAGKHIETEFFPLGASIRGMTTATGPTGRELVYTRVLSAPKASVFEAWTDPKKLARWWGPHAITNPECEVDLRPGGRYRIVMRGPNGVEYPLKGAFLEIARPDRLIFSVDASEHPAEWHAALQAQRPAGSTEQGLRAVVAVTLETHGRGTKITIVNQYGSVATRDAIVKLGSNDGWAQSLERLESLLAKSRRRPQPKKVEHRSVVRARDRSRRPHQRAS
jgi:uncharacterized protein YndB with AHSA1/START domain